MYKFKRVVDSYCDKPLKLLTEWFAESLISVFTNFSSGQRVGVDDGHHGQDHGKELK